MTIPSNSVPGHAYDETYFKSHCGEAYERSAPWLQFFGTIADTVVQQFSPKTALDAGCAIGMLVEALRNHGVNAEGFDISEYAISQAPEYLQPYVKTENILNPHATSKHYDMVICIEVLEHLTEAEGDIAIANLARWGDTILFSSSPEDFTEATHVNVRPPGYWVEKFAQHGLIYTPELDATYVSAWAMVFQRQPQVLPQILRDYSNFIWSQKRELLHSRSILQQAQEQNTLLTEHYRALKNKPIPVDPSVREQVDAAVAQEKSKRIKLAQAYMAQLEELSRGSRFRPGANAAPTLTTTNSMMRLRRRQLGAHMKYERLRALTKRSVLILRTDGPIAFTDRLGRWLRGERRYFPQKSQNRVATALSRQDFPVIRQTPTLSRFTVLFIVPTPEISSKRYRVFNIQEQLEKNHIKTNWMDEGEFLQEPGRALNFDIVVFARIAYHSIMEPFLERARKLGIQIAYEIDDMVFDVSMVKYIHAVAALSAEEQNDYIQVMGGYRDLLLRCDYFITSTAYIAEAARGWGKKPYVIRNGMNGRQIELAEQALQAKAATAEIRIGYLSGSPTHQGDFAVAVPALVRILREFPEARLVIQGLLELPDTLKAVEAQIEKRPFVAWEQLVYDTARLDINLAPLEINPFTLGKSALKYFEAAIVEVPTIASPNEDFQAAIQQGITGFLATNEDEWYTYLRQLIVDPELRRTVGKNARQDALARYTAEAQSAHTLDVYQHILCRLDASAELPTELPPQKVESTEPAPYVPAATQRKNRGIRFHESAIVHQYLDGLTGLEIGAAAHNPFGLQTRNVGLTREFDAEDYEFFKASQIDMCGEWARIDIPASAEDIPVANNSQDFVISSHVWEHLASPLLALEEWCRVVRPNGYILAIVPKRDAEPTDVGRPLTPIEELVKHYELRSTPADRKHNEGITSLHFTVFSPEIFPQIAAWYNSIHESIQLLEVAFLETDDKVGNGHLILWKVVKTLDAAL